MADLYPIYLNLEDKRCLVVGGGKVALRKVTGLLEAGANVTVVSPDAKSEIKELAKKNKITLHQRPFKEDDICDEWLVFCATDDEEVNRNVFNASEKARIPSNVADVPSLCRFQVPSRFKDQQLQIALSTRGGSPALARRLKLELKKILTPWAARLVEWMRDTRRVVMELKPDNPTWRTNFFNQLVDSNLDELKKLAQENKRDSFDELVNKALKNFGADS